MKSERQKKILLMKVCVVIVTIFIFVVWAYNMKNVWRPINIKNNATTAQNSDLLKFKEDINKQMTEINNRLNEKISDKKQEEISKNGDELLKKIIQDAKSTTSSLINTSTIVISSSTPNLIKQSNNCPAYINCMPSIGETRSCRIPVGCEGITEIAY